jgi:hypothetical protein
MDADRSPDPLMVGWREYVDFPDWSIRRVKAKIDTGARTSALDAAGYELRPGDGEVLVAALRLALDRKHLDRVRVIHVPVVAMVAVRNTSGVFEQRPLIETTIRLGPVSKRVQLTITNRADMRFPMILGRRALQHDFIVDVSRQYLLRRQS